MAKLWNNAASSWEDVPDAEAPARFLSGTHAFGQGTHTLISDDGTVVDVPAENLQQAFKMGARLALPGELDNLQKIERHSGTAEQLKTAMEGVGRTMTAGLSDLALPAVGLTTREDIAARKEINPITAGVSELAGYVMPGGALSAVGKGATAVGKLAASKLAPTAGRIATSAVEHAVGSAIEGAFIESGALVSEAALGDPTVNAEKILARVGAGALLGGGLGVLFGGGGAALGEGLSRGKRAVIEGLSGAKGGSLETVADRLAYRSLGGGQRALSKIGPARAEKAGRAVREELGTGFGTRSLEENMSRLKAAHEEAGQTIGKIYSKMDNAQVGLPDARNIMERVMDDVYRPMFDNPASRNEAGKVLRELQPFLDDIQAGKTPTWADLHGWRVEFDKKARFFARSADPATSAMRDIRRIFSDELETGAEKTAAALGEDTLAQLRSANQRYSALQDVIAAGKIGLERKGGNQIFGLTSYLSALGGAGIGGVPGAAIGLFGRKILQDYGAQASSELVGRLSTLTTVERAAQAVDKKLGQAVQQLSSDLPLRPPVSIGGKTAARDVGAMIEKVREEGTLLQQLISDPGALAASISEKIGAVTEHAPQTATQLSIGLTNVLRFLAEKAPKPVATMPALGIYDPMTVSDIDRWQRYKTAALDPMRAVGNIVRGQPSPEEIETLQRLYPSLALQLKQQLVDRLAKRKTPLPSDRRDLVGQILGVGSTKENSKGFIRLMQKSYAKPKEQTGRSGGSGGLGRLSQGLQTTAGRIGR